MKKLIAFLLMFLLLLFLAPSSWATTYYVNTASSGGDGTTTATSGANAAFATVAAAQAAVTGDQSDNSLLFNRTQQWREQFTVGANGTAGHPFTIGAYGSGVVPIISGANLITGFAQTSGTDFTSDADLCAYYYVENNLNDSHANANNLTDVNSSITFNTTYKKQGSYSALFAPASTTTATRADASLSTGFPGKNGGADASFTVGGWFRYVGAGTGSQSLMRKGDAWQITTTGDPKPGFWVQNNAAGLIYITANSTITTGVWYHIVGRYNVTSGEVTLFINGAKQTATDTAVGVYQNSSTFQVGYRDAGFSYFNGYNDELFVFKRALGDTEILAIYNTGINGGNPNIWKKTGITTEPKVVLMNNHFGQSYAAVGSLSAEYDWYYNATDDELFVFSPADPATRYTAPGVEAAQRDYGIRGQDKSYVTVDSITTRLSNNSGVEFLTVAGTAGNIIINNAVSEYNYINGINLLGTNEYKIGPIVVTNPTTRYNSAFGIIIDAYATDITITNPIVHHNAWLRAASGHWPLAGIRAIVAADTPANITNITTTGGSIYENGIDPNGTVYADASVYQTGIGIHYDGIDTGTISKVHIYSNVNDGIDVEKSVDVEISYNIVNNHKGRSGDYEKGIWVNISGTDHGPIRNSVYNNTVYDNECGIVVGPINTSVADGITYTSVKNNIVYGSTIYSLWAGGGGENDGTYGSNNVYSNNDWGTAAADFLSWGVSTHQSTLADWVTASSQTGNIAADPLFVSATDFHLQPTSPARRAGVSVGLATDYEGRTVSQVPNIGAYDGQRKTIGRRIMPGL